MGWWSKQSARYKDLLAEYGTLALVVYLTIFVLTVAGFYIAISAGYEVSSAAGSVGKVGAAYAASKVVQPLRIVATIVLTPIVAGLKHRFFGGPEPVVAKPDQETDAA